MGKKKTTEKNNVYMTISTVMVKQSQIVFQIFFNTYETMKQLINT